jgi:hypothetical protein
MKMMANGQTTKIRTPPEMQITEIEMLVALREYLLGQKLFSTTFFPACGNILINS